MSDDDEIEVNDAELAGDQGANVEDADDDIVTQGKAFINFYLDHELPLEGNTMLLCSECDQDETIPDDLRFELWKKGKLEEHQRSNIHTGFQRFICKHSQQISDQGHCTCGFCDEVRPDTAPINDTEKHNRVDRLRIHIENSDEGQIQGQGRWKDDHDRIDEHEVSKSNPIAFEKTITDPPISAPQEGSRMVRAHFQDTQRRVPREGEAPSSLDHSGCARQHEI